MNGLREICHCGHDISSHHLEHGAPAKTPRGTCLAMYCKCERYVNEHEPKQDTLRPSRDPYDQFVK